MILSKFVEFANKFPVCELIARESCVWIKEEKMTKIKKALLSIVCCFAVIFCCAFVFTACTDAEYTSYNITIDKAIQSGWVKVQGDAIAGEEITIVLNPDTGYEIVPGSLKVNGKEIVGNKFIMPEGNVNVTAKFKKINYAVNTGSIEHGTVDIEVSAQEIASGDSTEWGAKVTLTPVPEKGYECTGITVLNNGVQVLVAREGNKWSFIMPQGNITIDATFSKVIHTLTKQTEHGSFTIPATASYGDTVEVTNITADPGYVFSKIIVNGNTITGTSFKMPDSNTTVQVVFKAVDYTVSKNNVDHARISLSKIKANYGDTITVSVTPDEGYIVSAIKVNGVAISGNSFVVEGDSVVTVELTAIDYSITVNSSENGSIVPDKTTANVGDLITLTVNPDATYKLGDLIIKNGDSFVARLVDGNTVTFTMPAGNVTISATFAQDGYKINVIYYEGANIVVTPTIATPGTKVYIYDLGADAGYEYGDELRLFWSGGDLSESLQMEDGPDGEDLVYFIMPNGEVTLDLPCFKKSAHNITKEETTNGSFDLSADSAYEGDYITITVHPAEGYELDEVYVNGYSRGQNLGFSMEGSDMTVRVTFKKATYTITREGATEHGYFDVQDQAQYGEEVVITEQNTEAGYEAVFTVMCNGTPVTVTDNKFTMPAGNVTISVSYTLISYSISVDEENIENGSVSVIPTIAKMGDEITITVTPDDGYSLKAISVLYDANNDGNYQTLIPAKTEDENVFVFNMIANNVKIRAEFAIKYSITANEATNGTVEANVSEAFEGDFVTLIAHPNTGYVLTALRVNGSEININNISSNAYEFAMPAEEANITAEFGATDDCYTLTLVDIDYTLNQNEITITKVKCSETSYIIPDILVIDGTNYTVTGIGNGSYVVDTDAIKVILPTSIKNINASAFRGCSALTSILIPQTVTIGARAFMECTNITSVILPEGISTISQYAFAGCTGLTSITIPSSVEVINRDAFEGCTGLESIIVDKGNAIYNSGDGANCIIETETSTIILGCKTTVIPSSVTKIGPEAFKSCASLTTLVIPNSVTEIGGGAFWNCTGLLSITISRNIVSLPNLIFRGCTSLMDVEIPNSIIEIGQEAFRYCKNLNTVIIPEGVTHIWRRAFEGCSSLKSISISSTVQNIDFYAFSGCSSLESITVSKSNPYYNSGNGANCILTKEGALVAACKNTIIPEGVISILDGAFIGCTGLTSITLPSSLIMISPGAFWDSDVNYSVSDLTSIIVTEGLNIILGKVQIV